MAGAQPGEGRRGWRIARGPRLLDPTELNGGVLAALPVTGRGVLTFANLWAPARMALADSLEQPGRGAMW